MQQQKEAPSPNLSGYLRFFHLLQKMENERKINASEKKLLKKKLTLKDYELTQIIAVIQSNEEVEDSLLQYIRSEPYPTKCTRSKSSAYDVSPTKHLKGDDLINHSITYIDKLVKQLNKIANQTDALIENSYFAKIDALIQAAKNVKSLQNYFSLDEDSSKNELVVKMKEIYKSIKVLYIEIKQRYSRYMNSLLALMDEKVAMANVYDFLDNLMQQLLGSSHYSFIVMKNLKLELYCSREKSYRNFDLSKEQLDELVQINSIAKIEELPHLKFKIPNNSNTYLIKLSDLEYFIIHSDDALIHNFIPLSLSYNYFESLQSFCRFVMHTLEQIKVSYFSTLSISDALIESGMDLVRCSKYLLLEELFKDLRTQYSIEKDDSNTPTNTQLYLKFKDGQGQLEYQVKNMDLGNMLDLRIYDLLQCLFQRYSQFLKQCYERIAYYKFFLRSRNIIMLEFDKSGKLQFLSKAIGAKVKQKYQLQLNKRQLGESSYQELFELNQTMLQSINNYISDNKKWQLEKDNETEGYEIFIKREENQFKGFSIILFETEWQRRKTLPTHQNQDIKRLKQQLLQTETMDYINKLEEYNPDIRNSVVSMFMPQKDTEIQNNQVQKTPTLIFRKLDKSQVVGKKSFFFQQREVERQSMKLNPNKFNESHLSCRDEDGILDAFSFNILEIKDQIEKSRLVYSMFQRQNYIQMFAVPVDKFVNFLNEIEQLYNQNQNPFHNFDHGIAVMQSTNFITKQFNMNMLTHQVKFCLLLSALCHDVAHTGKTNVYEANSLSQLAIRYHDKVILEQHHAATTVKILRESSTCILCNFSDSEFKQFRKQLINNILATDMQEHFKMLKEFESKIPSLGNDQDDLQLLCGMIIHTSDFNGPARKWPISKLWSEKINQEYRAQYEEEGKRGFAQQPFMKDLDKMDVMAKNEMGFFKVIVRPLYLAMNTFSKGVLKECLDNLDESIIEWDKILQIQSENK